MQQSTEQQIITAWHKNAAPWITAVRQDEIESRVLVTNQAMLAAISSRTPKTVLDIGCGEGWLVRTLASQGIDAWGVDIVPELIAAARSAGPGHYQTLAYADLCEASFDTRFDLVVCNFSLLGKESVEHIFRQVPLLLNAASAFIVQTLHPRAACADGEYQDGWRRGSWQGFSKQFRDPAPWYFRTLESWQDLYAACGLKLLETREPPHPVTGLPASLVLVGAVA